MSRAGSPLGAQATAALAASNLLAKAGVRDWFYLGPMQSEIPATASAAIPSASIGSNITVQQIGKFGALIPWRRWEQPDPIVRAPSLPLAWLLAPAAAATPGTSTHTQQNIVWGQPRCRI